MMDPLSAVASIASSIGSAFKFIEVASHVFDVETDNTVFISTIEGVCLTLHEVERMLQLEVVQKRLTATPERLTFIQEVINGTVNVLFEIAKRVERVRVEKETTGSIRLDTRLRWVLSDHEKLKGRQTQLLTYHQNLSSVLTILSLEVGLNSPATLNRESTTCLDEISLNRIRDMIKESTLQIDMRLEGA